MQSDCYSPRLRCDNDLIIKRGKAVDCIAMDTTWQQMAEKLQGFNVLSYLSSHDTRLFHEA